jgi:hypothetical protein
VASTRDGNSQDESLTPRRRWTEARVIKALLELDRRGVPISQRGLVEAGEQELAQAINYFGGLRRARRVAGLPPPTRRWTPAVLRSEDVLVEIRRRQQAGEPLASSQVPLALQYAGQRSFGSWRAAITAAGLDYDSIRLTREYSDEDLLERIRTLARERPEITLSDLGKHSLASTLRERFGSLEEAAIRAGCPGWPLRRRRHTTYDKRRRGRDQ